MQYQDFLDKYSLPSGEFKDLPNKNITAQKIRDFALAILETIGRETLDMSSNTQKEYGFYDDANRFTGIKIIFTTPASILIHFYLQNEVVFETSSDNGLNLYDSTNFFYNLIPTNDWNRAKFSILNQERQIFTTKIEAVPPSSTSVTLPFSNANRRIYHIATSAVDTIIVNTAGYLNVYDTDSPSSSLNGLRGQEISILFYPTNDGYFAYFGGSGGDFTHTPIFFDANNWWRADVLISQMAGSLNAQTFVSLIRMEQPIEL